MSHFPALISIKWFKLLQEHNIETTVCKSMSLNLISGKSKRQTIEGAGGIGQIYPRNASPPSMCPRVGPCYFSHTYPFNLFLSKTAYRRNQPSLNPPKITHQLHILHYNGNKFCSTVFVCLQLYEHIGFKN